MLRENAVVLDYANGSEMSIAKRLRTMRGEKRLRREQSFRTQRQARRTYFQRGIFNAATRRTNRRNRLRRKIHAAFRLVDIYRAACCFVIRHLIFRPHQR